MRLSVIRNVSQQLVFVSFQSPPVSSHLIMPQESGHPGRIIPHQKYLSHRLDPRIPEPFFQPLLCRPHFLLPGSTPKRDHPHLPFWHRNDPHLTVERLGDLGRGFSRRHHKRHRGGVGNHRGRHRQSIVGGIFPRDISKQQIEP